VVWTSSSSTFSGRGNGVSWSLWAKVVNGEIDEIRTTGDFPKEFFLAVNGHSGDHDNVSFSISLPAKDSPNIEAKEVKPE
jgi:hypothetical protein